MLIYYLIPLLGALIGWITNKIAIYLIFRPYKPFVVPIINYSFQGLIPKRRATIAQDIGNLVEGDLLSIDDLFLQIRAPELQQKIVEGLGIAIYQHLLQRLPMSLPRGLKNIIFQQIQEVVRREAPVLLSKLLDDLSQDLKEQISFSELVREKIDSYDLGHMEQMIVRIVAKELKHIEIIGGILGFIIGLVQVVLVQFLMG